ncbi:MAG: hypothetical protein WCL06_14755, partial [Bacteroidota bacterium]
MKTLFKTLFLIAITTAMVSCKSTNQTSRSFEDDVYVKKGGPVQTTVDEYNRSNRPVEPSKNY